MNCGGASVDKTLFIDTNLDTHFALIVSDQDSISDLKGKILSEHPLCFPSFGGIKINALKVKRKECFYHLTDRMYVKNVFHGVKNNWFLSADASRVMNHDIANVSEPSNALLCITNGLLVDGVDKLPDGTSNKMSLDDDSKLQGFDPDDSIREVLKDLEMQVKHVSGDRCKILSPDSCEKIQEKCDLISKGNEMLRSPIKYKKESSSNVISDLQCHFPSKEDVQNEALSNIKNIKKRKCDSPFDPCALKVNIGSFNDTNMGNKHITDEAERGANGLKEMMVDVPAITPVEESPDTHTTTKRRRLVKKNREGLIFDSSNKEKKKTENKSKQKPSRNAAVAVPSYLEDIREENTKAISEGRRDFGKVPDEAIIHEKIVEDGDSVIVQDAVTVPEVLSNGVLIDIGTNEVEYAKTGKENESVDPEVILQEKSMKEVVDVPAGTNEIESAKTGKENESFDPEVILQEKSMKELVDVPANIPVGESPDASTTTKRRQKINKKSEDMLCDSSNKEKTTTQKLSYSNNDRGVAAPSCLEDTREESTKATLDGRQNFGKGPNEAIIHDKVLEDAPLRENYSVTVQEGVTVLEFLSHGNETAAAKTEEINEWLRKNYPEVMPEEKSMNEVVDPSIMLEGSRVAEPEKISGKGKRVKKTKKTKGKLQLSSEMEYSVASGKTSTEILKAVHENVEKSVQPMHVEKPVEISENQEVKGRKKIRKKNSSGVESFSGVQMEKQDVDHSIERKKEPHVLSKKIRRPDLVETSSENQINSNLQSDKDTVNTLLSLQFEAVVDEDPTNDFTDETNKKIDSTTSHGDKDIMKASDTFLPRQNPHKVHDSVVAFDDKVIQSRMKVRRVKAKKNSEESGVGNSSTIQGSLRENDTSDKLGPCLQKGSSKVSENKKAAQSSASRPKNVKVSTTPTPKMSKFSN